MNTLKIFYGLCAAFLITQSLPAQAVEVGQEAPCVMLDHMQGGVMSNHCLREPQVPNRPVIVEFFSITCSACIANLPKLKTLGQDLQGMATIRLISIDRDVTKVKEFIKQHQIDFEVGFDNDRDAKRAYDIIATPTLFVLDQANIVALKHVGSLSTQSYGDVVAKVKELQ